MKSAKNSIESSLDRSHPPKEEPHPEVEEKETSHEEQDEITKANEAGTHEGQEEEEENREVQERDPSTDISNTRVDEDVMGTTTVTQPESTTETGVEPVFVKENQTSVDASFLIATNIDSEPSTATPPPPLTTTTTTTTTTTSESTHPVVIETEKAEVVTLVGVNGSSLDPVVSDLDISATSTAPVATKNKPSSSPKSLAEYKHAYETAQRVILQAKNTTRNACKAAKAFQMQLAENTKQLKMREAQLEKVQSTAAQLRIENEAMKESVAKLTQQCRSYESELVHLATKVEDYESLDDSFQTAQETIQQLQRQVAEAGRGGASGPSSSSFSSTAAAASSSANTASSERGLGVSSSSSLDRDETVQQLHLQLDNMRQELEKEQRESQSKQMQLNTLKKQLKMNKARTPKEQAEQIQEMADQNTRLHREVEELSERFQSAAFQAQELELSLETYREKCSALQSKYERVSLQLQMQQSPSEVPEEEEEEETPLTASEREATLINSVKQLETQMQKLKDESVVREQMYQGELEILKSRVQEFDSSQQDSDAEIAAATAPLIRKIELLKHQHSEQVIAYQEVEHRLTRDLRERDEDVSELLAERDTIVRTRRDLELTVEQLKLRESSLSDAVNAQTTSNRQLNSRVLELEAEVDAAKMKLEKLTANNETLSKLRTELEQTIEDLKTKQQQMSRGHHLHPHMSHHHHAPTGSPTNLSEDFPSRSNPGGTHPVGKSSELEAILNAHQVPHIRGTSHGTEASAIPLGAESPGMSPSSSSDMSHGLDSVSTPMSSMASMRMDQLNALLRQREGEVDSLRKHIEALSNSRNALSDQLVSLRSENGELRSRADLVPQLEEQLHHISLRHEVALEVIGEKEDELLRMKDEAVQAKEAFRKQSENLIDELNRLKRQTGAY